ncbi:tetratricopeptide repeat protein [bacterium]|nr:tetratricopeptide repeat protein [bacterium]
MMAMVYNSLGWAYYDLGHFVKARDYWAQARTLYEAAQKAEGVADVYGGMGWVSYLLGQNDDAERYFHQAIDTYETLHDTRGIAINRGDLGVVRIAQGEYGAAIHELDAALQLTDINQLMSEMSYKAHIWRRPICSPTILRRHSARCSLSLSRMKRSICRCAGLIWGGADAAGADAGGGRKFHEGD